MNERFYSRRTLELFLDPPNTGVLAAPDGRGEARSTTCSDHLVVTVQVVGGRITAVRFLTEGCAAAIAAGAAVTELARGMTVAEARALTVDDVASYLGGLPEGKVACASIAPQALYQALLEVE